MLPNFLIIGSAKAGTTSLWAYLRNHPDVFMVEPKEVDFFATERNWSRGIEWYEKQFERANNAIAIGEASPTYTRYPHHRGIPARIASLLPDVRLIYLVRHPIERMISDYKMHARLWGRFANEPIENALLNMPVFLDTSRYAMQIEQYLDYLPRERLLIIESDDLKQARATTLRRVYEFLGVDSNWLPADLEKDYGVSRREVNTVRHFAPTLRKVPGYKAVASVAPPSLKELKRRITGRKITSDFSLSEGVRRELEDRLRPDIGRFRRYMGAAFDGWGIG